MSKSQKTGGGQNTNQQNGPGKSTPIAPSVVQDQIRRDKKAKQKANGGRSGIQVDGFLAALQEDRRAQRELEAYGFQCEQAALAATHEGIVALKAGSLAAKVANTMLDAFPQAEPYEKDGQKVSKTQAAYEEALLTLNGDEIMRTGAINLGASKARHALRWAFEELKNGATPQVSEPTVKANMPKPSDVFPPKKQETVDA